MTIRKVSFVLLVLFVLSIPCEDSFSLGGLGSVSRLIGLVAMAFWVFSVIKDRKIRKIHPFYLFFLLFILWNIVSLVWSFDRSLSMNRIITYVQLAFVSWILWDQVTDQNKLQTILQAYILGAYVSVFGTILNFIRGKESYEYSGGRFAANGFNADDLAIILAISLPIAWYLILKIGGTKSKKWSNLLNLIYLPLALFAIILTGSRAGFLCTLMAIIYFVLTINKQKIWVRIFLVALTILSIISIFTLIPASTVQRVANSFQDLQSGSLSGRENIYKSAGQVIIDHPLLGIGTGAFKIASGTNTFAHNSFLSVLSETGAIGFLLFFCILLITILEIFSQPKAEAYFWFTLFMVWGFGASSVSWEFQKPTWLVLSLIVISAAISKESKLSFESNEANQENQNLAEPIFAESSH